MTEFASFLSQHPVFVLFTCISLGFLIGRIPIGSVRLGGMCGTLLMALLLGQAHVAVAPGTSGLAFSLYIFSLGYLAGPQFFASLSRRDVQLLVFPVIEIAIAIPLVLLAARLLGLGPGAAAGLFAGGASQSAALGITAETLSRSNLSETELATQQVDLAAVYSLAYLCSLVTIVLFTSQLAPALLRADLAADATQLLRRFRTRTGTTLGHEVDLRGRTFELRHGEPLSAAELEDQLGARVVVAGVLRGGAVLPRTGQLRLLPGDVIRLVGDRTTLAAAATICGPETAPPPELTEPLRTFDTMVTRRRLRTAGGSFDTLLARHEDVAVADINRSGQPMPLTATSVQPGDIVTLVGTTDAASKAAKDLGQPIDRTRKVDFTFLGAGLALGILIGLPELRWGALDLTIGTGGGALLAGLVCGWLRTKRAAIGSYDPAAAEVVKDLGLALFVGIVGLTAAPQLVPLLTRYGPTIPLAAVVVAVVPAAVALVVAAKVLRLPSPLALGAVAGQQGNGPGLAAVMQRAGNTTPLITYMTVYAMSSVLLPMVGPVIVGLVPLAP